MAIVMEGILFIIEQPINMAVKKPLQFLSLFTMLRAVEEVVVAAVLSVTDSNNKYFCNTFFFIYEFVRSMKSSLSYLINLLTLSGHY
jgi:hypothetical protein